MNLEDEVIAKTVSYANGRGMRVLGLWCTPVEADAGTIVVIPPGYERRIHHYSVLSRYLVRAGFSTLRFDHTDHVGASEGEVRNLTMTSMADDVVHVVRALKGEMPKRRVAVLAPSLAGRATIRALSSEPELYVDALVLLLPVTDVEYTVERAAEMEVFEMFRRGELTNPTYRVVKHDIEPEFVRRAIEDGYCGVEGTRAELASLRVNVTAIVAESDDWVRVDDARDAMSGTSSWNRHLVVIEATSHDISSNPSVIRFVLETILAALTDHPGRTVDHLTFDEIVETVGTERNWAQAYARGEDGLSFSSPSAVPVEVGGVRQCS